MEEHTYDDGYWAFAADALLQRLDAVAQETAGVRLGQDIEYVHRMRVASRRLRSALTIFEPCLEAGGLHGFQKPIRRVTKELGAARDIDVQLEALTDFINSDPDKSHRPGIERLMLRLQQQRNKMQLRVVAEIDRLLASPVWQDMQRPLRELTVRANLRGTRRESKALRHSAARSVTQELEGLLAHEPYIEQPERSEELHQMRIAAKKLRYSLEIFAPLYSGALNEPLATAKEVQKILGDIHDCDVWIGSLPLFVEEERQRTEDYFGHCRQFGRIASGLDYFRAEKIRERQKHYEKFVNYWREVKALGVWEKLHHALTHAHATAAHATSGHTTAAHRVEKTETVHSGESHAASSGSLSSVGAGKTGEHERSELGGT